MAIYLRGDMWWFEVKTSHIRIRKSTGFKKNEKRKAQAVFDAARLAALTNVRKDAVESILKAIYDGKQKQNKIPLLSITQIHADWTAAKCRVVSDKTALWQRNVITRFNNWATNRGIIDLEDVGVAIAREYARKLKSDGMANKTQRNTIGALSAYWRAAVESLPGIHNPWQGVVPDDDGTSERRGAFTPDEETRVLDAAHEIGHDWYRASLISRYTAMRYGDVARLTWEQIDMDKRIIAVTPSKTARHGVRVTLPIADTLYSELTLTPPESRVGFVLPEHGMHYGQPLSVPFSDVLKAAGINTTQYTFHSWRHTCASRLSESGASTDILRRFGGWTNDHMAHHYDHAERLDEMREAIEK